MLLDQGVLSDIWLYKAAHHGSKYSNSPKLLQVIKPEISVISCSRTNVYGHPHAETLERFKFENCTIFNTMESGQITFQLNKGRIRIDEFRE